MTYQYLTQERVKRTLKIPDVYSDETLQGCCIAATTVIDESTGRRMQPYTATRTFDGPPTAYCTDGYGRFPSQRILLHEDLISVTTLKTDDGTRTYPHLWAAGSWDLGPEDAIYKNPPHPYYYIDRVQGAISSYGWPAGMTRGIQIAGRFGFYEVLQAVTALTAAAVADTTTRTIAVDSLKEFDIGQTLRIDSEDMYVRALNGGASPTLTVDRNQNGTTPAEHADDSPIQVYQYPVVDQAALFLVSRYLRRSEDAPMGIVQSIDGFMRLAINDPDVIGLLAGFSLTAMR